MFEIPRRKLLGMTMAVLGFFTTLSIFALAKSLVGYHGIAGQINRRPPVGLRPGNGRHAHRVSSRCRSVDAELIRRTEDRNPAPCRRHTAVKARSRRPLRCAPVIAEPGQVLVGLVFAKFFFEPRHQS